MTAEGGGMPLRRLATKNRKTQESMPILIGGQRFPNSSAQSPQKTRFPQRMTLRPPQGPI